VVDRQPFVLQGSEAALAREFDAHDATLRDAAARCAFWRDAAPRLAVERSPHAAGDPKPDKLLDYVRARAQRPCASADEASAAARAQQRKAVEQGCAERFPAALAAAKEAAQKYEEARKAHEAAHPSAPAVKEAVTPRSDAALRQWVAGHIGIKKLPCSPADSDYLVGLQVSNRSKSALACEFSATPAGSSTPALRRSVSVAVEQTERMEVAVRSCLTASTPPRDSMKLTLTCHLSEANRSEAGIDDPHLTWFGYDVDSLELTSESAPSERFTGAPPPPVPERARFIAECVAAQIP
jgi:hypothetical protein